MFYYAIFWFQFHSWYSLFSIVCSNIMVCSHEICTCTFSHFTHSLGVFWSLDLRIEVHIYSILLIRYLENTTRIARSSDLFIRSSDLGYCSCIFLHFLFHLFDSLYRPGSAFFYLIIHKIMLLCIEIYMSYCSIRMLFLETIWLVHVTLGLACMHGYFLRVYMSLTLIVSPLQRILGSEAWQAPSRWWGARWPAEAEREEERE